MKCFVVIYSFYGLSLILFLLFSLSPLLFSSSSSLAPVLPVTLPVICLTAVMGTVLLTGAPNLALQGCACVAGNALGSKQNVGQLSVSGHVEEFLGGEKKKTTEKVCFTPESCSVFCLCHV